MAKQFLPVLLILVVSFLFSAGMMAMAAMMGARSRTHGAAKRAPYESGVPQIGGPNKRISVKFYLVALVFVVLDVEIAFLYPWAINFREQIAGSPAAALLEILAFIAPLAVVFAYIWRKGVFDWGGVRSRRTGSPGGGPPSSTGRDSVHRRPANEGSRARHRPQ